MSLIMSKPVDKVNQSDAGEDVVELMHSVVHQVRSRQFQALRDGGHDLTHLEMRVLNYFTHHPGATQSDLAQFSGRDKAQLARLIKGLRERGLLDAHASDDDRRNLHLTLTASGEVLQRAVKRQGRALALAATEGFTDQQRAQLIELLKRVAANIG
ncbi:hypothetical protein BH09PSE6_BH09PSE6_01910 [soil metagenome]